MTQPVLVELWRGDIVESFHRGAFVVVDAAGAVLRQGGDIDRPVYARSAVKGLQALPLVASGAAERFGLTDAELALACASHGGQAEHVATAASMLAKAGLDLGVLECGVHWPSNELAARALAASGATPCPLHNNCSGKHSGFACLGALMAGDADAARGLLRGYVEPAHPVMREIGAAIEAATGARLADAPRATDGCSIPTFGIPLRALAHAFARFGTGTGLNPGYARAAARLRWAVAAAPLMVAGTGRLDTRLMAPLRHAPVLQGRRRGRLLRDAARTRPGHRAEDRRRQQRAGGRGGAGRAGRVAAAPERCGPGIRGAAARRRIEELERAARRPPEVRGRIGRAAALTGSPPSQRVSAPPCRPPPARSRRPGSRGRPPGPGGPRRSARACPPPST